MININRNALKAVSLFAGVKDVRYYLNGVLIQAAPNTTRLVATDGHTLGAHQTVADDLNTGYCSIIVPNDAIKAALAIKGADGFELNGGPDNWTLTARGQSIGFARIDGDFIDYQQAVPSQLSGEAGYFNPKYLVRVQNALCALGSRAGLYGLGYNGPDGAALVSAPEYGFMAVIMPMREHAPDPAGTEWAREQVPTAPKAKAKAKNESAVTEGA